MQTNYPFSETQITFSPYNHSLDNNDNFSPDNMWLVYDTRTNNGGIRRGKTIEKVNINTKEIIESYEISKIKKKREECAVWWNEYKKKLQENFAKKINL